MVQVDQQSALQGSSRWSCLVINATARRGPYHPWALHLYINCQAPG